MMTGAKVFLIYNISKLLLIDLVYYKFIGNFAPWYNTTGLLQALSDDRMSDAK